MVVAAWLLVAFFVPGAVAVSVSDVRSHRIPNAWSAVMAIGLGVGVVGAAATCDAWSMAGRAAMAAVVLFAGGVLGAIGLGVGMGDVKLLVSVGLLTGWFSWATVGMALFVAVASAAVWAVVLLVRGYRRDVHMPLGPFLCAGAVVAASVAAITTTST